MWDAVADKLSPHPHPERDDPSVLALPLQSS
jgi:hypothetical protein